MSPLTIKTVSAKVRADTVLKIGDVAPTVQDGTLRVCNVDSRVRSDVLTLADDLTLVVVDGWADTKTYMGGIFVFTLGPLGWKRVNLSPKVVKQVRTLARTRSTSDKAKAAQLADLAISRKKAWDLAAKQRKAGLHAYVDPYHPGCVVRFTDEEFAAAQGESFESQAEMVRFLISMRGG